MAFLGHLAIRETFNSSLTLTILLIAVSQFNLGFDQLGFSATQAMDAFERQFGTYNPVTEVYFLESWWLSLFTSLPTSDLVAVCKLNQGISLDLGLAP